MPPALQTILERKKVVVSAMGKSGNDYGKSIEEFCATILSDSTLLSKYNAGESPSSAAEDYYYFQEIVNKDFVPGHGVLCKIITTRNIPRTDRGGSPKTDILATYIYSDGFQKVLKYSSKQSSIKSVACGQFRVDDMFHCCNITDPRTQALWRQFQNDGSGINLTQDDISYLTSQMMPIREAVWCFLLAGGPNPDCNDVRIANRILTFRSDKQTGNIKDFNVHTINEYTEKYKYNVRVHKRSGEIIKTVRTGGFGTGASFTRASKSNSKDIQVKLPI